MSRYTIFVVLLISFLICFSSLSVGIRPVSADPKTIVVPDDYPTIQGAINHANNGDTVFVKQGTYHEGSLNVDRSITLAGQDNESTVIDGGVGYILKIDSNNVVIKGFTLQNVIGIGCFVFGSNCSIFGNDFIGDDDAVVLLGQNNTVSNNFFDNNTDVGIAVGVGSSGSACNMINGNTIDHSSLAGIYVSNGNNNTIVDNNVIASLDMGIDVIFFSCGNLIANNNISNCGWAGSVDMEEVGGIALEVHSQSNKIVGNIISNNMIGLGERNHSDKNLIYHNAFINNSIQVFDDTTPPHNDPPCNNTWDNGYPSGGNFWSDYNGTDLYRGPYQNVTGSDGIGDTPYVTDANNIDHYPLMNPGTPQYNVVVTAVATDCKWVYQGRTANINVTVWNYGDFTENVNVTLYYNVTANQIVGTQNITLFAGEDETLPFVWNTAGVAPCYTNYTLTAVATIPTRTNTLSEGNITVRILGDINATGKVDMKDISIAARAFGSHLGDSRWNPDADVNGDGKIDLRDIALIAKHFGEHS